MSALKERADIIRTSAIVIIFFMFIVLSGPIQA